MDFVLPPLLWLGVGKRSLGWRILNWTIVVGYSGIAIAGARPQALMHLSRPSSVCYGQSSWLGKWKNLAAMRVCVLLLCVSKHTRESTGICLQSGREHV